jgi:hypothetical protein
LWYFSAACGFAKGVTDLQMHSAAAIGPPWWLRFGKLHPFFVVF